MAIQSRAEGVGGFFRGWGIHIPTKAMGSQLSER